MRKTAVFSIALLFFLFACDKESPPPETPATANDTPSYTPPRPEPINGTGTATTGAKPVLEVRTWTRDKGLVLLSSGQRLTVPANSLFVLYPYPPLPYEQDVAHVGPMVTTREGGYTVLKLAQNAEPGVYEVKLRAYDQEFNLTVEVQAAN